MSKVSTYHHFIPKFYLNNFTDANNQFYIYLVREKRFKKNGKLFSPSSHFFIKNGNTIKQFGKKEDFLEKEHYSNLDSEVALIFEKINSNEGISKCGLTDFEIVKLNYFFTHLFWRNPKNDELIRQLIQAKSIKAFGFKLIDENRQEIFDENIDNIIKNHPDIYKLLKYTFPLNTFTNNFITNMDYTLLPFPKSNLPSLLGDNPIIFNNNDKIDTYLEEIIIPITKSIIFIRSNNLDVQFHSSTKVLIDMLQLKQANEYVCCTNKEYILQLDSVFENEFKSIDRLRSLIFFDLKKK